MGNMIIVGPNGKRFKVNAPAGASPEEVEEMFARQNGGARGKVVQDEPADVTNLRNQYQSGQMGLGGGGFADSIADPNSPPVMRSVRAQPARVVPENPEDIGLIRKAGDLATGAYSGLANAVGATVGLGTYVPGLNKLADPAAEFLYGAGEAIDETLLSDFQLAKKRELQADLQDAIKDMPPLPDDASTMDKVKYAADFIINQGGAAAGFIKENPGQVTNLLAETVPYIFAGGAIGKGASTSVNLLNDAVAVGSKAKAVTAQAAETVGKYAGAVGEGLVAAGDVGAGTAINQREQGNYDYDSQRLLGLLTAPATAVVGGLGSKVSGVADVDALAARAFGAGTAPTNLLSLPGRVTKGAAVEGAEELVQGGSEQVFSNLANDEDVYQGVGSSAVLGLAAGSSLGAAVNLRKPSTQGTELEAIKAERLAEETELQAAQLADEQAVAEQEKEDVAALNRSRRAAAQTFTPKKEFIAARTTALASQEKAATAQALVDVSNPQTEIGQKFEETINQNGLYDGDEIKKAAKDFVKEYRKTQKADPKAQEAQLNQEYIAALDQRAAEIAVNPEVAEQTPVPPTAELAEGTPQEVVAQPEEMDAKPAKPPTKKEQMRTLAVEQLGENFEVDHPELSQLLETGTGSRGKNKKSKFESMLSRIVKEEAANAQTEQAAPAAEATSSPFLDDSEVRAGLKPQQAKVYDAILKAANDNTLNELFSVTFESGAETQAKTSSSEPENTMVKDSTLAAVRKARRTVLEDAGVKPDVVKSVFKTKKAKPSAADEVRGVKSQPQPLALYQQIRVLKNANVAADVITAFKSAVAPTPQQKAPKERGFRVEVNNDLLKTMSGIANPKSASTATSAVVSKLRSQYGEDGLREMLTRAGVTTGGGLDVADTATANDLLGEGGAATATVSSAGGSQSSGAAAKAAAAQKKSESQLMKKAGMSDAEIKSFYDIEATVPELAETDEASVRAAAEASVSATAGMLAQSWDSSASRRNAPLFADLTMDQQIEWMHHSNAADMSNAMDRFDVLDNQQREIERAATSGPETQNDQVSEPQTEERTEEEPDTRTAESESGGGSVEAVRSADTGPTPQEPSTEATEDVAQETDTGVVGEAKAAPKVEVRKRKKITPPKFSLDEAKAGATGTTAGNVRDAVKWLIGEDVNWRVNVINSPDQLIGMVLSKEVNIDGLTLGGILDRSNARGVVVEDRDGVTQAFFFSDNITPGTERGAVIHELGSHLGMDNVLTREQLTTATNKIREWASTKGTSLEKTIAQRALERVSSAEAQNAVADNDSETLAYFLEEAVNAGVTPNSDSKSSLVQFVRQIWADFKSALRKLRPANEAALSAQDLVNMARGSARLELATDFHGSTAAFRTANPDYFGLGNNAVGVGFYISEDIAVGGQYMMERMKQRASMGGVLQRVDTAVAENEYLNWEAPLSEQPAVVDAFGSLPEEIQTALLQDSRLDSVEKLNGRQFYLGLTQLQLRDQTLQDYVSDAAFARSNKMDRGTTKAMSVASAFLDANGVKGIKTQIKTTSSNPNPMFNKIIFNDKNVVVVGRNDAADVDTNTTTPGTIKFSVPPEETNKQVDWIKKNMGEGAGQAATNLLEVAKAPYTATKNLDRVIRDNEAALPSARKWMNTMLDAEGTRNEVLGMVESVVNQTRPLNMERKEIFSDFVGASTFFQKWGYDPQWTDADGNKIEVQIDPVMKKKYDRLTAEEQQVARDLFNHGRTLQVTMHEIAKDLGVSKFFKLDSKLVGPYAPLKRFGDYVAELKSQELLDAQDALKSDPSDANRKKVEELKSDGAHYVVSFFDSQGSGDVFADANRANYPYAVASRKAEDFDEGRPGGAQAYEKILGAVNANMAGLGQTEKDAMAKMIRDMYFQTLDDSNARLSSSRRLNRAGYDKDMIRAFATHGMAQANLIAQLKHGAEITQALVETKKEAMENPRALTPIYNQLAQKYRAVMTPRTGMFASLENSVMKFNSFYMLTSSMGYFFQNMTQPYFSVANIAGEFGWAQAKTWGKLLSGYGVAKKVINTSFMNQLKNVASIGLLGGNSTVELNIDKAPPELRPLLQSLQLRGLLDVGITEDLRHVNIDAGNAVTRGYDEMTHRLYQSARYVEANNRIASAVAAFRMAQANPAKMKRLNMTPREFALRIVQDTQGNFSQLDAPALFDALPSKAPLQFRKYQFQMAFLHIDAAKQAYKGADTEIKMAGFRKLSLMMGYTGLFGGLASVPLSNAVTAIVQAIISGLNPDDDDELNPDKSLERWLRESIEDERTATLLSRGVPAALGWDFSQKLDQADLFMPYNSKYVQIDPSRDGALLFAAQTLLGPTGTMVGNVGNIMDFANRGNLYRAGEYMMPKGLRSYFETMRYAGDGYETRAGLTITDPTTFDAFDFMTNAMGLPSTEINQIKWKRGQQVEIEQWFSSETTRITRGFRDAREDGDKEAKNRYRDEFKELQRAKDRVRPFFNNSRRVLKRSTVMDLYKAPRKQRSAQRRLDSITGR